MKCLILRWNLLGWLLLMPVAAGFGQTEKPAGQAGSQASDTGEPTYQISERTVRQNQSSAGVSLGILGLYDSNYLGTASLQQGQEIIAIAPRLFANLRQRNSLLYLNYQIMYRRYPGGRTADAIDHTAGLGYEFRPWRRIGVRLSESARYGPNDIRASTTAAVTNSSQQVFYDSQNLFSNSLSGAVSITSGRKHRLDLAGSHSLMRFASTPEENTSNATVHAIHEYQWSRRWFLDSEVSSDWVRSANSTRSGEIVRFLSGPALKLGAGWTVGGQIGADRTREASGNNVQPSYGASVTKVSTDTRVGLEYWRRASYQIGLPGLNRADSIIARWEQRFRSRLSISMQTQYYRTSGVESVGNLKTISGSAGIEYAVIPSILASMSVNYLYQRQQSTAVPRDNLNVDRYMISIGLYYFYPATKR
jgi:hypothetical protein